MAKTQFKNITSETELYPASDLYTKTEVNNKIDNKIGGAIHYKGSVATYTDLLAITGQEVGDMYNVKATGKNYVWAENPDMSDPPVAGWDDISTTVDLSNYYTKTEANEEFISNDELTNTLTDYVQKDGNKVLSDNNYTTTEKNKLAGIDAGAEVNTIETVKVNNSALTPDANKAVNIPKADSSTLGVVKLTSVVPTDQASVDSDAALSQMAGWSIGQAMNNKANKSELTITAGTGADADKTTIQLKSGTSAQVLTAHQNAYKTVKVGSTNLSATSAGDTIELVAGDNISITPNTSDGKKITISSSSAVTSVNGQTGAVVIGTATTSASGLMSATDKDKLDNIAENANRGFVGVTAYNGQTQGNTAIGTQLIINGSKNVSVTAVQADPNYAQINLSVEDGTTSRKGVVQLSNSTSDSSTQKAATAAAVKAAYDRGSAGVTAAATAQSTADAAVAKTSITDALTTGSGGVLEAFPTSGYTVAQLVTHYNNLLTALNSMITNINNQ